MLRIWFPVEDYLLLLLIIAIIKYKGHLFASNNNQHRVRNLILLWHTFLYLNFSYNFLNNFNSFDYNWHFLVRLKHIIYEYFCTIIFTSTCRYSYIKILFQTYLWGATCRWAYYVSPLKSDFYLFSSIYMRPNIYYNKFLVFTKQQVWSRYHHNANNIFSNANYNNNDTGTLRK